MCTEDHNQPQGEAMLKEAGDGYHKYVCPACGSDNIGESGLGGSLVHCFGHCMSDVPRADCKTVPVTDEDELRALQQPAY
jgi:hypothetical protein